MSRIPSPARSEGAPVRQRSKLRRTLSMASAKSDASGRLSSVVEQAIQSDQLKWSLMRTSVLPDDTNIEMPRRASWWKRLEGSSRDILEALDTNKMEDNLLLEDFEIEVQKKTVNQSVQESSDNESVASIVVPTRRLFSQKQQPLGIFGDNIGSRMSLGKSNLEDYDNTINIMPKNLFKQGEPMNRPVFPAALLNSTNKTVNQTVEPETNKQGRKLFGQAGTKRKKNMFTDFVLSESEDDSDVQNQVFTFKKNSNKRISLASRSRRMPSLTPSVTTDIDMDDWKLLPSSTMIGNGSGAMELSRIITDKDIEQAQNQNADVTLTDANETLKPESDKNDESKTEEKLSRKQSDEFEKTLNDEVIDVVQASKKHGVDGIVKLDDVNNTLQSNKTLRPEIPINKTLEKDLSNGDEIIQKDQGGKILQYNNVEIAKSEQITVSGNEKVLESSKRASIECKVINQNDVLDEAPNNDNINEQSTENEPSIENKMAEMHRESGDIEKSESKSDMSEEHERQNSTKETSNEDQDEDVEELVWNEKYDDNASDKTEEIDDDHNEKDHEDDVDDQNDDNGEQEVSEHSTPIKDVTNKTQNIIASSLLNTSGKKMEQTNDVDETPDTTYDTTGRNRKKNDTQVKSPEAILNNMSKENMSFKPIGRSTSFRKSKSPTDDINTRRTLIPIQESIIGSDGSRNSSSEGSGWDSHRTTRKTLRQTFGKDFTPRKSLRALVMANSAKRQTVGGKDTFKINKMINKPNKTALEDQHIRNQCVPIRDLSNEHLSNPKSPVPEISAHHVSDPLITKPQISYHKSVHENNELGISHQLINHEASNQALNYSGPEISMHASYSTGMSSKSFNNPLEDNFRPNEKKSTAKRHFVRQETDYEMQEELDYDPSVQENSIREASSTDMSEHENSTKVKQVSETQNTSEQRNSDRELSDASKLEMEVSEPEESEQEQDAQESEQETENQESEQEEEHKQGQPGSEVSDDEKEHEETQQEIEEESEHEEIQQEIQADSEQEEHEETRQEIEAESEQEEREDTQQEIEAESEQEEREETQQEIEAESEQEDEQGESQREIEAESEQEEENEETRQEIEAESEYEEEHEGTEQEIVAESDEELEQSREHSESQETVNVTEHESGKESDHIYDEPDIEINSDHEQNDQEDSQKNVSRRFTERVVFDNEMSDQEIDYELSEQVSRQTTDNEISEQVSDDEFEEVISGVSEQAKDHDVSIGTQKSMLVMQMQKIAQENMKIRQKIREEVQNSLQQKRFAYNEMSSMQSKYLSSIRRIKKLEPTQSKKKPKPTTFAIKGLPKEFMEDLKYKPPKRFQPANAPWITKRLYKYLETKLEPKYDYRARVRAERLVQNIYEFTKIVRRRDLAPQNAVDELKKEMAHLNIVHTHFEFHEFFHEFMPREIRIKVNPDIVNKIPLPRNGIFGDILQSQPIVN